MKRDSIKNVARFVGSLTVGTLTELLVKQNVIPSSTYEKIAVGVGSFILSDMLSVKAGDHIDTEIDKILDSFDKIKNGVEEKDKQKQEVVVQKYEETKVEE